MSKKPKVDYKAFVSSSIELKGEETFFGYYDKSPVNSSGTHILFHASTRATYKKPSTAVAVKVAVKELHTDKEAEFATSTAYNWQQGCRAQWLNNEEFIFNNFDAERGIYVSEIINLRDRDLNRTLDFPVYDTAEKVGLSLNFNRLALLRPDYGYRNLVEGGDYELLEDARDGVFICDLINNRVELLISLEYLKKLSEVEKLESHKVNHLMINQDASQFVFLYRYFNKGRKFDCLICSDIGGKDVRVLSSNEIISHYCWISPREIVAYMRGPDQKERYYCINTDSGQTKVYGEGIIDQFGDGHPSYANGLLIFDTYPDKSRHKKLLAFDPGSDSLWEMGRFFESFRYGGETRCDLHPRHLINTDFISVDSVHQGKRQMYLIKLDKK